MNKFILLPLLHFSLLGLLVLTGCVNAPPTAAPVVLTLPPTAEPTATTTPTATRTRMPTPAPTSTVTPIPTPTRDFNPKYPKLHAMLQNLIKGFESGNLTGNQAASQSPLHYADTILVTVDVTTNIDAIGAWMEGQNISSRLKISDGISPYFYAYVPVLLLGALSQQSGVTLVKPTAPPWADLSDYTVGAAVIQVEGTPTPTLDSDNPKSPDIPIWLKGSHPYPRLRPPLRNIVYRYERGEITEAEAAAEIGNNYGSAVYVDVYVVDDPVRTDAIVSWLRSKNVSPNKIHTGHAVVGYIPVSVLGDLSNQPGVTYIQGLHKSYTNQELLGGPQSKVAGPLPTRPTPTS